MESDLWLGFEERKVWEPLFQAALKARANAYAPYSSFMVGAAVMTADGTMYSGANYESASYGLTLCAERAALVAAQASGVVSEITTIAICAKPGSEEAFGDDAVVRPCGACRQWLFEASKRAGHDIQVLCGNSDFSKVVLTSAEKLLPDGFSL